MAREFKLEVKSFISWFGCHNMFFNFHRFELLFLQYFSYFFVNASHLLWRYTTTFSHLCQIIARTKPVEAQHFAANHGLLKNQVQHLLL
jgi:hypothetical protein